MVHPAALAPLLLAAAVLPAPCLPTCEVLGEGLLGFFPAVVVLRSGQEVTWRGLDNAGHINYEGLTNFDPEVSCFVARYAGTLADRVAFHLDAGQLRAEQAGTAKPCTFAAALPGGAMALPYQCVLHPLTMKGALVVVP